MFYNLRQAYERLLWRLNRRRQDPMNRYRTRGIVKTKEDVEALHMFFSPTRVPPGLSEDQAKLCIALYPRRRAQTKNPGFSMPAFLPNELMPSGWMTRARFDAGIRKFVSVA